jgi:hypothetical protein
MRKIWKDKRKREERKRENKKKQKAGEMVGDQTASHAANPLKSGKKNNHQFWNSRIAVLVVVMPLH